MAEAQKMLLINNHRGMALLLVLAVVSLLSVVIIQFNKSMRLSLTESVHYQDREMLRSMSESGIDIAAAVLHTDRQLGEYDTLLESWAILEAEPFKDMFNNGEMQVTITDLSGRFPINSLVSVAQEGQNQQGAEVEGPTPEQSKELLFRLLTSGAFAVEDDAQAREIVDSLVDWLDSDDEESPYGAESSYYQSLEKPYLPRNGKCIFTDELLLVKGVSKELLYGNDEKVGLSEYIDVFSEKNGININTAPLLLIQVLDDRISSEDSELLDEFRRDENSSEALQNKDWYRAVNGWPGDIVIDEKLLSISSDYFLVNAAARYRESNAGITAVLERPDAEQLKILYHRAN